MLPQNKNRSINKYAHLSENTIDVICWRYNQASNHNSPKIGISSWLTSIIPIAQQRVPGFEVKLKNTFWKVIYKEIKGIDKNNLIKEMILSAGIFKNKWLINMSCKKSQFIMNLK